MAVVRIYDGRRFIDVECSDEFAQQYQEIEHRDYLAERKETRRHQSLGEFCVPDSSADIVAGFENKEMSGELKFALSKLTNKQRKVVIFHAIYKMSFREIGDQLGISKVTVHEHYHSAIKKLKKFCKTP